MTQAYIELRDLQDKLQSILILTEQCKAKGFSEFNTLAYTKNYIRQLLKEYDDLENMI